MRRTERTNDNSRPPTACATRTLNCVWKTLSRASCFVERTGASTMFCYSSEPMLRKCSTARSRCSGEVSSRVSLVSRLWMQQLTLHATTSGLALAARMKKRLLEDFCCSRDTRVVGEVRLPLQSPTENSMVVEFGQAPSMFKKISLRHSSPERFDSVMIKSGFASFKASAASCTTSGSGLRCLVTQGGQLALALSASAKTRYRPPLFGQNGPSGGFGSPISKHGLNFESTKSI